MNLFLKRLLLLLGTVIVVVIICIYLAIPSILTVRIVSQFECNAVVVGRTINNNWKKVFSNHTNSSFHVGLHDYKVKNALYNGSRIDITNGDKSFESVVLLLPISVNQSALQWTVIIKTGNNPITKALTYFRVRSLHNDMSSVSRQLQTYLSNIKNIYGYTITRSTLTDTTVLVTTTVVSDYPTTSEIYASIAKLKKYIRSNEAQVTNYPMLNVSRVNKGYTVMVGLPINRALPQRGDMATRHLKPVKNKIVTTEVKGGISIIQNAHNNIEQYLQDYSLTTPVIPFELLVTDRSKETDTTKWITRIVYPIF